jgi:glycosyltransferase involved in cell wall biosynthesis
MRRLAISNHGLRNSGGIERYALTLVRGMHERGLRPFFIAKSFDPSLPEVAWVEPIRVRMTGLPAKLRDLAFDWRIRSIKRRRGLFPLIACNQTGAADLAICGSTHPGYLDAMGQSARLSDRWKIALEHAHLSKAQAVVAHSRRMADEAQRYHGVPAARIHLLYPPVDGRIFSPVDPAERRRLRGQFGLPQDRAVFLLASTGHKRKGLDLLVDFFRSTALPVSLAVAGRPIAVRAPNIHYLGYRKDIENVYRAVDFTIVASTYEPFGLVGVESVLCGTPVLIADGAGCAEVILPPAQLPFDRLVDASLGAAVAEALARWRSATARLEAPAQCLGYDPSVSAHVDALLAIARGLSADR